MSELFCIANLLEVGGKKTFLILDFNPHQTKIRQGCSYRKDIGTRRKSKSKEKIELKFAILQKQVKKHVSWRKC